MYANVRKRTDVREVARRSGWRGAGLVEPGTMRGFARVFVNLREPA